MGTTTEDTRKGTCEKCGRTNRTLYPGGGLFAGWWCGTCEHREMRRVNAREMVDRLMEEYNRKLVAT